MRGSDFQWTVKQPEYWDAVMETLLILWVIGCLLAVKINNVIRALLIFAVIAMVSFLHGFFFGLLGAGIYIWCIYHIGNNVCKLLKLEGNHLAIILGMAIITIFIAILSIVHLGTPEMIRKLFPIIGLIMVIGDRKTIIGHLKKIPWAVNWQEEKLKNKYFMAFETLILTGICIIISKANYCTDYDSLWYGFKSQYVLAPFTGIYDNINLVACVYTYPKMFEIITLIFSGLNTYSFIVGINVLLSVLILHVVFKIGQELDIRNCNNILISVCVVLTPAIMNMAISAKADISSLYFQCVAIWIIIRAINTKNKSYWLIALGIMITTYALKSTCILFSSLIIIVMIIYKIKNKLKVNRKSVIYFLILMVANAFVYCRTMLITGLPMTSLVVPILTMLGFKIKYPYTLVSSRVTTVRELFEGGLLWERLKRIPKLFFFPNSSDVVTTEWTWWGILFSIIWIGVIIYTFMHIKKLILNIKIGNAESYIGIIFVVLSAFSFGTMLLLDKPDGNYYITLQVVTYVYLAIIVQNYVNIHNILIILPLLFCNILLEIAISCSWSVGYTPIDLKNKGYYNHQEKYVDSIISANGLDDVYNYMGNHDKDRYLICAINNEDSLLLLPGITELYGHQKTWAEYSLESEDQFKEFCVAVDMRHILVEDEFIQEDKNLNIMIEHLKEQNLLYIELQSNGYTMYGVNQ